MAITNTFRHIPRTLAEWDRFIRAASLAINGIPIEAQSTRYKAVTSAYTTTVDDHILDCSGTFTVTLKDLLPIGKKYIVKNSGVGTITVAATDIDGSGTATVAAGNAKTFHCIGDSAYIITGSY